MDAGPELCLREGRDSDRDDVLALAASALTTSVAPARDWVEAWWDASAVGRFVFEQGGALAGFYLLGFLAGADGRHLVGEVLALAVHPRARRQGLAQAMLEHAAAVVAAAAHGAIERALDVQVAVSNTAARVLYRQAGFVELAGAGSAYPDGTPALRLRRALVATMD